MASSRRVVRSPSHPALAGEPEPITTLRWYLVSVPKPETVDQYLASLPDDRRSALAAVRAVIRDNLPEGYEEGIQYGMIGYYVPHAIYPAGYHANPKEPLPFVSLASQKSHMALYLMCVAGDADLQRWFADEHAKTGKKLDMGKSCVRFKKLDDLPLELVGRTVARVSVAEYVARARVMAPAKPKAKAPAKKVAAKAKAKASAKKVAAKPKAKATARKAAKR